jgi:hypothetical protein
MKANGLMTKKSGTRECKLLKTKDVTKLKERKSLESNENNADRAKNVLEDVCRNAGVLGFDVVRFKRAG